MIIRRDFFSPAVLVLGFILFVLTTVWLTLLEQHSKTRWLHVALRLLAIGLLAIMFLQISLRGTHRGRPFVVMMLDNTASLQFSDSYTKAESQKLQTLAPSLIDGQRLQLLQTAFTNSDQRWLRSLLSSHRVEVNEFSTSARTVIELNNRTDARLDDLKDLVEDLKFNESATNLNDSVADIFTTHRGSLPDGIVLFTDGTSSVGETGSLSDIAARCRKAKLPLYVVGLGSQRSPDDVSIQNVRYESTGFAGSEMQIEVNLAKTSSQTQEVSVSLMQFQNETVSSESLKMQKSGSATLTTPPLKPGRNEFQVYVNEIPGEADLRNNNVQIHIHARETPLRVLMIERLPRWEFHHLKKTWERDPNVSLDVFLMDSDVQFSQEDKTAITQLPTTLEEVLKYDVVVLGDVDLQKINSQFLKHLPVLLNEKGGGLLLITGTQFNPATYINSPLAKLLPLQSYSIDTSSKRELALRLTLEGRANRLFFLKDEIDSWEQFKLPSIPITNLELRPGVTTLLEGRVTGQTSQPLIVSMRTGNGQVLQHLFDQSWRWRSAESIYDTYWSQAVRFIAKQRMQLHKSPYELTIPREQFQVGEVVPIQLQVHSPNENTPESIDLLLQKDGQALPTVSLKHMVKQKNDVSDSFQVSLRDLLPGTYIASVNPTGIANVTSPVTASWTVINVDRERTYAPMNQRDLIEAARQSGGQFYAIWELDQLTNDLPKSSRGQQLHSEEVPIWNRWEIIALLAFCLTFDWILQRTRTE